MINTKADRRSTHITRHWITSFRLLNLRIFSPIFLKKALNFDKFSHIPKKLSFRFRPFMNCMITSIHWIGSDSLSQIPRLSAFVKAEITLTRAKLCQSREQHLESQGIFGLSSVRSRSSIDMNCRIGDRTKRWTFFYLFVVTFDVEHFWALDI